jgi:hypothetical protein
MVDFGFSRFFEPDDGNVSKMNTRIGTVISFFLLLARIYGP